MKYVAFLRAINVGGRVVKMDRLRELFSAMRLSNVETFIASGNVIFDSKAADVSALEKKIEAALQKALGYRSATFVRSTPELAKIAETNPFEDEGTLYIGFMQKAPAAEAQRKLLSYNSEVDTFHFDGRELYWLTRGRISDTPFSGPMLEKSLGLEATLRNVNTVRKLAAKYC
jgi:uncharacterized protein (DUF1697 family)